MAGPELRLDPRFTQDSRAPGESARLLTKVSGLDVMTDMLILQSSVAYLSTFYCRADLGKRVAIFFSATSLAGAFSGLLAAALVQMEGLGGKRGWAWIFIMCVSCMPHTHRVLPQ